MKVFVALISGALLSSAAIAQHEHGASTGGGNETRTTEATEPAAAVSGTETSAARDDVAERRVCRRFDNTSSRLGRERVCKTAAEWREYDRNN